MMASATTFHVDAGPFVGMRDSGDSSSADPTRANLLQNVYPLEAELGGGVVGRPGLEVMGAQSPAGAAVGQGVVQFTKLDGREFTVRVIGGRFETYDWSLETWSETLTTAQLTSASVTLSATGRVALVPFADNLFVGDGVNTQFLWDGTSGGGITKLVDVPVFYGPPTVFAAKLVGIKASARNTIVWSEEQDATVGYEQPTYDNAWELMQTDQNQLVAIRGTNTALYYWRERSTGSVTGQMDTQFATTATHDGTSQSEGTKSPWAIVEDDDGFLFLNADGRPMRLTGTRIVEVWQDLRETLAIIPRTTLPDAIGINYTPAGLLLIGLTETAQQHPSVWLVYRKGPDGWIAAGLWRGFLSTVAAMVKDAQGVPTWVHCSSDGYTYRHGNPDGDLWNDALVGGTAAVTHVVQGMPMAPDKARSAYYDRLDFICRAVNSLTLSVDADTPYGFVTPLSLTAAPHTGASSLWDVFQWDVGFWGSGPVEMHSAIGLDAQGRWIRPRITHSALDEQFGLLGWRVDGQPVSDDPYEP